MDDLNQLVLTTHEQKYWMSFNLAHIGLLNNRAPITGIEQAKIFKNYICWQKEVTEQNVKNKIYN